VKIELEVVELNKELIMCAEVKQVQEVANKFIKKELTALDYELTKEDKIIFVNSLATLNVLGDFLKKSLMV